MGMHTTTNREANGEIELYYENKESNYNSHTETIRSASLMADKKTVILTIHDAWLEAIRTANTRITNERYALTVDELIDLFKEHGKQLPANRQSAQ